MTEFDDAMSKLIREDVHAKFEKNVSPHFVGAEPVGFEPIGDILKRVDDQEIREDIFLNSVRLEYESLESRLRHRADMMIRRAAEFNTMADGIRDRINGVNRMVETTLDHISGLNSLLDEHAHIEPEVIKP